jgi:hypothetical protein
MDENMPARVRGYTAIFAASDCDMVNDCSQAVAHGFAGNLRAAAIHSGGKG